MRSVRSLFCGLLLALLGTGAVQAQTTLYQSSPSTGSSCLSPTGQNAATEVTTPASPTYQISSVTLNVTSFSASNLVVSLYSDASGLPGSPVAALGTATLGTGGAAPVTLTPTTPVALSASTRYWIVASTNGTGNCDIAWNFGTAPTSSPLTHTDDATTSSGSVGVEWRRQLCDHRDRQRGNGSTSARGDCSGPDPFPVGVDPLERRFRLVRRGLFASARTLSP